MTPESIPAVSRMFSSMYVIDVFPLVPVIPTTTMSFEGKPKKAAETSARAFLVSSVRRTAIPLSASQLNSTDLFLFSTTAGAPFSTAAEI